jgi:hypothetical protein
LRGHVGSFVRSEPLAQLPKDGEDHGFGSLAIALQRGGDFLHEE